MDLLPTNNNSSNNSSSSISSIISSNVNKLDAALIHRVLLTEPTEWSNLTMSGLPRVLHTLSLEEFSQDINHDSLHTVKRAFRDYLLNTVLEQQQQRQQKATSDSSTTNKHHPLEQLSRLLMELHRNIRHLVPNRKDLHSFLNDHDAATATKLSDVLTCLIRAAQGLQQLESEARAETTMAWLELAQETQTQELQAQQLQEQQKTLPSSSSASSPSTSSQFSNFVITSLLYLLYKCELCQADKDDFYLSQLWAPRIHQQGVELERQAFYRRYGKITDPTTAPLTRKWVQALVMNERTRRSNGSSDNTLSALPSSTTQRQDLVRLGWVNDILFRSADQPPLALPEILALDVDRLQQIRRVTRWAAAGSALFWHASQYTTDSNNNNNNNNTHSLSTPAPPLTPLAMRQASLLQAMQSLSSFSSVEAYEAAVTDQVRALALECNPSIDAARLEALLNRTLQVLRGNDPVLTLLDQRMKQIFGNLIVLPDVMVVPMVRSGRSPSPQQQQQQQQQQRDDNDDTNHHAISSNSTWNSFLTQAQQQFAAKGLALYAKPLAMAAKLARKVIDLAFVVFDDVLLEPMIRQACNNNNNNECISEPATTTTTP